MKYIKVPNEVKINNIIENKSCLAPSKYTGFYPKDMTKFDLLSKFIEIGRTRAKVKNNQKYVYVEIGDVEVDTGYINYKEEYGVQLPTKNPISIKLNDILISTVRTYRKGIGFVDSDKCNLTCTPAFLVVDDVKNGITKEYLFAVLRSDFFVEQILGLQNRGMYPRLDKDTINQVYIPIPNTSILDYVSKLTRALLNKESELRRKSLHINTIIENELINNQKLISYKYQYPRISEITEETRLDTGIYEDEFKHIDFIVKNYKNGYFL